jgi:hypothetical protein
MIARILINEKGSGNHTQENVQPGADRRQVLKILLGGAYGIGGCRWAKPVVDVIIAPAHAQTSPTTTPAPTTTVD